MSFPNADMRRDHERTLMLKVLPTLLRMLNSSGPWLDCPFCHGGDCGRADSDPTWYHSDTCPLRMVPELLEPDQ